MLWFMLCTKILLINKDQELQNEFHVPMKEMYAALTLSCFYTDNSKESI